MIGVVSKLFPNFPVVKTTREAVHVQFPTRKLVFTIIPIASEGSISKDGLCERRQTLPLCMLCLVNLGKTVCIISLDL